MTDKEAMKLALEALEGMYIDGFTMDDSPINNAIIALREALAEPEEKYKYGTPLLDAMTGKAEQPAQQQEPVAVEPLPCPFCGNSGLDFDEGSTYRWGIASCSGCGASCGEIRREYPDKGEWHKEAIAEWNRRTSPPAQRKPLTDEEIYDMYNEPRSDAEMLEFARAIEAAHGIKGDA